MSTEMWSELIKALPWGFVLIVMRWLDIKEKQEERKERDANAKEISEKNRETQIIMGKAYADAINNLASVVTDLKATIADQYKNLGITKDLLDIAKKELRK